MDTFVESKKSCRVWNPALEEKTPSSEPKIRKTIDEVSQILSSRKELTSQSSPPFPLVKKAGHMAQHAVLPQHNPVFNNYLQMLAAPFLARLHHQIHLPTSPIFHNHPPAQQTNSFLQTHPNNNFLHPIMATPFRHPVNLLGSTPPKTITLNENQTRPVEKPQLPINKKKWSRKLEQQLPEEVGKACMPQPSEVNELATVNPIVQSVLGGVMVGGGVTPNQSKNVNFNTCAICGTSFRITTDLVQHMRANHRQSRYKRKYNERSGGQQINIGKRSGEKVVIA